MGSSEYKQQHNTNIFLVKFELSLGRKASKKYAAAGFSKLTFTNSTVIQQVVI